MRVALFPADHKGCGYYRIFEPARVAALEPDVEVVHCSDEIPSRPMTNADGQTVYVPAESHADVMVFQRPAREDLYHWIRHVKYAQGKTVVIDVDDDMSCLHPNHPFRDELHPRTSPHANFQWLARACAEADLVTVTTRALAERYGQHGRVAVLPNCVPEALLRVPRDSDGMTLGWSGAASMHPGDLEVTGGAIPEVLRDTGWRFQVVGAEDGIAEALGLDTVSATGWCELPEWHLALGTLDVGIVPLGDTKFNHAKSALKGLEYAARGVPFVCSPTPEYAALVGEGVGIPAMWRTRNWRAAIKRLIEDPELRAELAEHGREIVKANHTFDRHGWRWAEAWQDALDRNPRRKEYA